MNTVMTHIFVERKWSDMSVKVQGDIEVDESRHCILTNFRCDTELTDAEVERAERKLIDHFIAYGSTEDYSDGEFAIGLSQALRLAPHAIMSLAEDMKTIIVCAWCPTKKDADSWCKVRGFNVSHGICPDCQKKHFPDAVQFDQGTVEMLAEGHTAIEQAKDTTKALREARAAVCGLTLEQLDSYEHHQRLDSICDLIDDEQRHSHQRQLAALHDDRELQLARINRLPLGQPHEC